MKKLTLFLFVAIFSLVACTPISKSGNSDTLYEGKDWYKDLDNWDKGASVELKLENLVGTWLRKNTTTNPPSKIELIIKSNKTITKKDFFNGKVISTYTGTLSIKNTNEVVLNLESVVIEGKDSINNLGIKYTYQSKLYQKYWECKEEKSGTWTSTEPFYKIK